MHHDRSRDRDALAPSDPLTYNNPGVFTSSMRKQQRAQQPAGVALLPWYGQGLFGRFGCRRQWL